MNDKKRPTSRRRLEDLLRGEIPKETTPRALLDALGLRRRTPASMKAVIDALKMVGLRPHPELDAVGLNDLVRLINPNEVLGEVHSDVAARESLSEKRPRFFAVQCTQRELPFAPASIDVAPPSRRLSPGLKIGTLPTARTSVVSVEPHTPLKKAVAWMCFKGYSQIPVITGQQRVLGVVSWRALGRSLVRGQVPAGSDRCEDHMEDRPTIYHTADLLLDALPRIISSDFILVRDEQDKISGIITATDIATFLHNRYKAFALVEEIEFLVRSLLGSVITNEDLRKVRAFSADRRRNPSIDDLTFGGYIKLLREPRIWGRLRLALDREEFIDRLGDVKDIRNGVMHFTLDEPSSEDIDALHSFLRVLRFLQPRSVAA